jgi:hypothetical protein
VFHRTYHTLCHTNETSATGETDGPSTGRPRRATSGGRSAVLFRAKKPGTCLFSGRAPRLPPAGLTARAGESVSLGADAPAGAPYANGGMLAGRPTHMKDRPNGSLKSLLREHESCHEGPDAWQARHLCNPWEYSRSAAGCHGVPSKGSKGSEGVTKGSGSVTPLSPGHCSGSGEKCQRVQEGFKGFTGCRRGSKPLPHSWHLSGHGLPTRVI